MKQLTLNFANVVKNNLSGEKPLMPTTVSKPLSDRETAADDEQQPLLPPRQTRDNDDKDK